jgi:hypothetical protein
MAMSLWEVSDADRVDFNGLAESAEGSDGKALARLSSI